MLNSTRNKLDCTGSQWSIVHAPTAHEKNNVQVSRGLEEPVEIMGYMHMKKKINKTR